MIIGFLKCYDVAIGLEQGIGTPVKKVIPRFLPRYETIRAESWFVGDESNNVLDRKTRLVGFESTSVLQNRFGRL